MAYDRDCVEETVKSEEIQRVIKRCFLIESPQIFVDSPDLLSCGPKTPLGGSSTGHRVFCIWEKQP